MTNDLYTWDARNRLIGISGFDVLCSPLSAVFTYDAYGNRMNMNRPAVTLPLREPVTNTSYNEANQMMTFNEKNITYDANGNMTSVTNSCGLTTYIWDVRNRLVGINGFKPDCSALTASFKYDALGRRIEKTINWRTIQYLYDGLDIVQEIENNLPTVNYISKTWSLVSALDT